MRRYITSILPTPAQWISFLILPLIFSVYFLITRYSDQFITTQGVDYIAVQDSVLASLYLTGQLSEWFTRFMDFAFWGVLASIVILVGWGFSVARTSVENHVTEQTFVNFQKNKQDWHGNFIIVAIIKVILVFTIVYCVFSFIAIALPRLALGIAQCVQAITWPHLQTVLLGIVLMVFYQALIVSAVKLLKITRAD